MVRGSYIIITAARNESEFLPRTIESVLKQTVLPAEWVIVDDCSVDDTVKIASEAAKNAPFIRLIRLNEHRVRDFSSKVCALNHAIMIVKDLPFEYLGVLDADITLPQDYFQDLMSKFANIPLLGIGGGLVQEEKNNILVPQVISLNSVAGAVQFFKKECLNIVGDFIPLPYGCEDAAAEIKARWAGFEVQTFQDLRVQHLKPESGKRIKIIKRRFLQGISHADIGYHPLFQVLRCLMRISQKPFAGSLVILGGYFFGKITLRRPVLEKEVVEYLQDEQKQRIRSIVESAFAFIKR